MSLVCSVIFIHHAFNANFHVHMVILQGVAPVAD